MTDRLKERALIKELEQLKADPAVAKVIRIFAIQRELKSIRDARLNTMLMEDVYGWGAQDR